MKNLTILIAILISSTIFSQNQTLLNESWFVYGGKNNGSPSWNHSMNLNSEVRTEITFLNDKMVIVDCCGGIFEIAVDYIGNDKILFLNLTEIQNPNCSPIGVYSTVKSIFNSMLGETIVFTIQNNSYLSGIKDITFNHPTDNSYIEFSNTPNEINGQAESPYWGHEPPNHQWSLTHVIYQGQTMELPYGAALTIADIYEGTFTISLCGEILVALNTSWNLDVPCCQGPSFISCGILENTVAACEPIAGFSNTYIETFKQNAFDFLSDNLNLTMYYQFTYGAARKLIISDYLQNKLIFHSNQNYLSVTENDLSPIISIYPNPVQETLHINLNSNQFAIATIFDLQGKKLLQNTLENSTSTIDVKTLAPGLYFIVVKNGNGENAVKKFIKK